MPCTLNSASAAGSVLCRLPSWPKADHEDKQVPLLYDSVQRDEAATDSEVQVTVHHDTFLQ